MAEHTPSELDLWRAANQVIKAHGDKAEKYATDMVMRALDDQAKDVWLTILGNVRALQRGYSPDTDIMN